MATASGSREKFAYEHPTVPADSCHMFISEKDRVLNQYITFSGTRLNLSYGLEENGDFKLLGARREDGDVVPSDSVPFRLFRLIEANAKHATERLRDVSPIAAKVNRKLEVLAQKFLTGKYSKLLNPGKSLSRKQICKLRRQHVFAGVVHHIGLDFYGIAGKIVQALEKAMAVDSALKIPELREERSRCTWLGHEEALIRDFEAIVGTDEAVEEVCSEFGEIKTTIQAALDTLESTSESGIKLNRKYKRLVATLIEAMHTLEPDDQVNLGNVLVSICCNSAVLQNLDEVVPEVELDFRSGILKELGYVCNAALQLSTVTKNIAVLSFYIAHKTLKKLLNIDQMKRVEWRRIQLNKIKGKASKRKSSAGAGGEPDHGMQAVLDTEPDLEKEEETLRREHEEFKLTKQLGIPINRGELRRKFLYE